MPYANVGFYKKANFDPKNVGIGFWVYLLDSSDPNHSLGLVLLKHTVRWVAFVQDHMNPITPTTSETEALHGN